MDCDVNRGRSLSSFKRLVSLIVLISYTLTSFPIYGLSNIQINSFNSQDINESEIQQILLSKIQEMKQIFISSDNRNLEAINSIQSLLNEVARNCNISISLNDLLEMSKINVSGMEIDEIARPYLMQAIDNLRTTNSALGQTVTETIFESIYIEQTLHSKNFEIYGYGIYPPWKWSWFGLNEKKHKHMKQQVLTSRQVTYPGPIPEDDGSIPDDLIICAVEALVIGLLFIIPSGYTQILAAAIAYDMGSRALEGVKEISTRNKEKSK